MFIFASSKICHNDFNSAGISGLPLAGAGDGGGKMLRFLLCINISGIIWSSSSVGLFLVSVF